MLCKFKKSLVYTLNVFTLDTDECETGRHICSSLEVCVNQPGGYICECVGGFHRDDEGWCVVDTTSSTTTSTTSTTTSTTTQRATPGKFISQGR